MGYLITAHIVKQRPRLEVLDQLPPSIACSVYHHRAVGVYILDVYRASRRPEYPFRTPVPSACIPLELPRELKDFEPLCTYLHRLKLANGFKSSYVNFSLLLNRLLAVPVFSFIADDDELDFACIATENVISGLKCRCGDMVITFQNGRTHIQPLIPEFEEDEELLTDLDALRTALPSHVIAQRNVEWKSQLHGLATEAWGSFSGGEPPILGLGSFDPPVDEEDWELIGGSNTGT